MNKKIITIIPTLNENDNIDYLFKTIINNKKSQYYLLMITQLMELETK